MEPEGEKRNQSPENQPPPDEKKTSGAAHLLYFVFAFIAILTFLFYVMGIYDIK